MAVTGYVGIDSLARLLGLAPAQALLLVRRTGPAGTIRLADGRFRVPASGVAGLRDASTRQA